MNEVLLVSDHGDPQRLRHRCFGLNPLLRYLKEEGIASEPFLERASLSSDALRSPEQSIGPAQEIGLTFDVYEAIGIPELGLRLGPRYHLSSYGVLGLAAISSPNLTECYRVILQNILLTWTFFQVKITRDNDSAFLQMDAIRDLGASTQFMIDRDLSAAWCIACEALGEPMPLRYVEFKHQQPGYAAVYEEVFQCPVRFAADHNRFCFDQRWLDQPLPQAELETSQVFGKECQKIAKSLQASENFTELVRHIILSKTHLVNLDAVSESINITPRTLQRKLAQEGTSFNELLKDVRVNIASEFLLTTRLSVEQIADRMGYHDSAAFSNAFKKMAGVTPKIFRNKKTSA